jgi:putative transcriptional regulator
MEAFGNERMASMTQVPSHANGPKLLGIRVTKVEILDAIRLPLRMSQRRFVFACSILFPRLMNCERGRRYPNAPAGAYLLAIKRSPKKIVEAKAR